MASQVSTSEIFKSLGARVADAHEASKNVAVAAVGGGGLPPGINNGVARLTVMEFVEGKDEDKGKYYFSARGIMRTPEHHDGIKVAGQPTKQLIPMFDTPKRKNKKTFLPDPKTEKGHYVDFRDLFAHLGVKPPPQMAAGESKEAFGQRIGTYYVGAMQILLDSTKPPVYFGVRTWQPDKVPGEKEPGTFEFWGDRCEYVERGAAANPAAGVSMAAPPPTMNPQQPFVEPPMGKQEPAVPPPATPTPAAAPVAVADDAQLAAWAEAADMDPGSDTDDGKAGVAGISAACKQCGVTNEEVDKPGMDWAAVVALIKQRRGGVVGGGGATGSPMGSNGAKPDPVKGDVRAYQSQQCEVTSVNAEAKTATLKVVGGKAITADGKLVKVPFAELS